MLRDVVVAGPVAGAAVDHEQHDVGQLERGLGLEADAARDLVGSWMSTPPVSISVRSTPFQSVCSALRSRVTPARSCTTASLDSGQAVDQARLADVRVADDRDRGVAAWRCRPSMISSSACCRARRVPSRKRRTSLDDLDLDRSPCSSFIALMRSVTASRASATMRLDDLLEFELRSCRPRTASAAATSGEYSRVVSRRSRSAWAACTSAASSPSSAARRSARSSSLAVRKIFSSASGRRRCRCRGLRRPSRRRRSSSSRCFSTSAGAHLGQLRRPRWRGRSPRACGSARDVARHRR